MKLYSYFCRKNVQTENAEACNTNVALQWAFEATEKPANSWEHKDRNGHDHSTVFHPFHHTGQCHRNIPNFHRFIFSQDSISEREKNAKKVQTTELLKPLTFTTDAFEHTLQES